jgi:hypothetical protein
MATHGVTVAASQILVREDVQAWSVPLQKAVDSIVASTGTGQELLGELTVLMGDRLLTGEQARRARLELALAILQDDAGGADRGFRSAALAALHRPVELSAALRNRSEDRVWEG